jgi:hypothetical protein
MLPGIRSVLIAIIAALGLLIGAFGVVAAFRVAQESRSGSFQAEFAQRSRVLVAANREPHDSAPTETPAPLEANPVRPVVIENAPDIAPPVVAATSPVELAAIEPASQLDSPAVEPAPAESQSTEPPPAVMAAAPESESAAVDPPAAEPPMGGPLPEQAEATHTPQQPHRGVNRVATLKKAHEEAARKATQEALAKARAARLARERKVAALKARAAQARAKQQAATANNVPFGSFGTSGTNNWDANSFGAGPFRR